MTLMLMEEILHYLGSMYKCNSQPLRRCRLSSTNSYIPPLARYPTILLTFHHTMVASISFSIIPINPQYTIVVSIWFSIIPILPQYNII